MIRTERLILRQWKLADEASLARHCNTAAVMRFLGGVVSDETLREEFRWLRAHQRRYGHTFWAMELRQSREFVGFCGLIRVDEPDSTVLDCLEIGWRIRGDRQRNGYASEAARACMDYAFHELDSLRVVARTRMENVPSLAVMQAIGMRHDPRLDYLAADGTSMVVFVMAQSEWPLAPPD